MIRRPVSAWAVPLAVSVVVTASIWLFAWPGLNPWLWRDAAYASGVRPPDLALGGMWRGVMALVYAWMSPGAAESLLRFAGGIGGGVAAALTYGVLDAVLPATIRYRVRSISRGRLVVNGILAGATLVFMCSDSVWRACQGAGPDLCQLVLMLVTIRLMLDFLIFGGMVRIFAATVTIGLLSGFGNMSFLLFCVLWWTVFLKSLRNLDAKENPLANPVTRNRVLVAMTFLYMFLVAVAMSVDYWLYYRLGGAVISDFLPADVATVVLADYYRVFVSVSSSFGWLFAFIFSASPLIIAFASLPKVMVEDRLQERTFAVAIFLMGLVGWSQVSGFPGLWARGWFPIVNVNDEFTVMMLSLVGTVTLTWAFAVLSLNLYFRNFRRIAWFQYGETEAGVSETALTSMDRFNRCLRIATLVLAGLALAGTLPMRNQRTLRNMLSVIDGYCREVVRECDGVDRLLTDGSLDEGVEMAAFRAGRNLHAISMLAGEDPREVRLRQRGAVDDLEMDVLGCTPLSVLDCWVRSETNRLSDCAIQFGLGFYRQKFKDNGIWFSGLVARFGTPDAGLSESGIAFAQELSERVLDICARQDPDAVGDALAIRLFRFVQWRLSQMCRARNDFTPENRWGLSEDLDESLRKRLDEANPVFQKLKARYDVRVDGPLGRLTPREGLRLGLERADFRLARTFAETVVRRFPDDAEANFALGMFYLMSEKHKQALPHFQTVHEVCGEDPTVLNNLAICYNALGDPAKAVHFAERALKVAPDVRQIKLNLEKYRKASRDLGWKALKKVTQ